ncbi:MAG: ABC transporter substrate-binding protein [Wenzhouxiangellaceae bacterium]
MVLGLATLLLVACGEPPVEDEGLRVYRHALDGMPNSLDPVHASTIYANHVVLNVYDTLYAYQYLARPYQLKPNLAQSMPEVSGDGLRYTIPIKPGVRFIDDPAFVDGQGRELIADDIVYSLLRHFDPASRSQGAWLWQGLIVGMDEWTAAGANYDQPPEGLQALDRHTLRISLTRPYPQLVHTLALGFSAVVPREAVARYGSELAVHPVGSGPYQLQRFDSVKAVLDANPGFRQEPFDLQAEGYDAETQQGLGLESLAGRSPPFVDRVEIHFIKEDSTRWSALLKGDEIDYARVPALHFDEVLASRDPITLRPQLAERFHLIPYIESGFVKTDFNMDDPSIGASPDAERAVRNRALRCALRKAFDWQQRNEVFYYGIGQVFPGVIPMASPEFDPEMSRDSVQFDPQGARRLLAEHGWNAENLPVLEYGYMNTVTNRQFFEQMRGFFEAIGYPQEKVRPLVYPSFGEFNQATREGEVMLIFSGWNMDYPDAQNTMQLYYGPNSAPGANAANYRNPEYDQLYREAAVLSPGPERTALYRRMNQIVVDDCVSITGISRTLLLMWNQRAILLPDRSFVSGFSLRYVALADQ